MCQGTEWEQARDKAISSRQQLGQEGSSGLLFLLESQHPITSLKSRQRFPGLARVGGAAYPRACASRGAADAPRGLGAAGVLGDSEPDCRQAGG